MTSFGGEPVGRAWEKLKWVGVFRGPSSKAKVTVEELDRAGIPNRLELHHDEPSSIPEVEIEVPDRSRDEALRTLRARDEA